MEIGRWREVGEGRRGFGLRGVKEGRSGRDLTDVPKLEEIC